MPALSWDLSTAYDLFVSLYVLHRPSQFGLRPSWAAGVRSRLPVAQREFFEKVQSFLPVPLRWLYLLPAGARDAADAVTTLAHTPAAERLAALSHSSQLTPEIIDTLRNLSSRQSWSPAELEVIRTHYQRRGFALKPAALTNLCDAWAHPVEFGERYLESLSVFYLNFYAEEEKRIRPGLVDGLQHAHLVAAGASPAQVLEALSHGVHFTGLDQYSEIILEPSFWSSPFVFYDAVLPGSLLVLFGCRTSEQNIIPSESVPADLTNRFKALSDPSRLAILRFLVDSPQTPGELARRLRLRTPTVIHHLNVLRLAGMVEITLLSGSERCYALRREALHDLLPALAGYLQTSLSES